VWTRQPRSRAIESEGAWQEADFLVSPRVAPPIKLLQEKGLARDELEMTGLLRAQTSDSITIKFPPNFEGYIWRSPRAIIFLSGYAE